MTDPLGDIEFLARSEHRFQVLEELSKRPHERAELQRSMDVSRTTILRTLSDMEEKGWIEGDGWRYRHTPLAEFIRTEFARTLDVADTVQKLNRVIEWVPIEAIDVDLHHFQDATISVASRNDPTLPVRKYAELKTTNGHVQTLIYGLDPFGLAEHRQAIEEIDQQFEAVFSAGLYEKLQHNPGIARDAMQVAASEQCDFYLCDEEFPLHLVVTEDAVGLLLTGTDGTFPAYIESHKEAVIAWANEKFEFYREDSTPLTAADIFSDGQHDDYESYTVGH